MATRKASSSKAKRPAAKTSAGARSTSSRKKAEQTEQPVIIEQETVEVVEVVETTPAEGIDDTKVPKTTFKEKMSGLKPGALIAEIVGTFVLTGAVIRLAQGGTVGLVGIGLVLAILVVIFGVISGSHLNPAITIAQYVNRKIDGVKAVAYILAQVIGALAAFVVLYSVFQSSYDSSVMAALAQQGVDAKTVSDAGGLAQWAATTPYATIDGVAKVLGITPFINVTLEKGTEWAVFFSELVGAIIFGVGVGYAVFSRNRSRIETGLAVGLSLFAGLAVGGASAVLNPAVAGAIRAFDWANPFAAGCMTFWWPVFIYIGATTVGITAGFTLYRYVLKSVFARK